MTEQTAIEKTIVTIVQNIPRICGAKITGPASLTLDPSRPIDEWRELISVLYGEVVKERRLNTALFFLVGDALSQAEAIYGEESACVYGVEMRWDTRTLANMIRCASAIPAELRNLDLSPRFYADIYGAELTYTELQGVIEDALHRKDDLDIDDWRAQILAEVSEKKVVGLLEDVPPETREHWEKVYRFYNKPHWRKMLSWIKGNTTPPPIPEDPARLVLRLLDENFKEADSDVRTAVSDVLWTALSACKSGSVSMREIP